MSVRRARPADGPAYIALVRALARFEHLRPPDDDACRRLLDDAFSDPPRYDLWVAEHTTDERGQQDAPASSSIVGYAVTFETYSTFLARPTLYLEDLFIHPDARRCGLATQMMTHLQEVARARGCCRLDWTVLGWNHDAKALYRRLGATLLSDWQLMRIDIDA